MSNVVYVLSLAIALLLGILLINWIINSLFRLYAGPRLTVMLQNGARISCKGRSSEFYLPVGAVICAFEIDGLRGRGAYIEYVWTDYSDVISRQALSTAEGVNNSLMLIPESLEAGIDFESISACLFICGFEVCRLSLQVDVMQEESKAA